MNLNFDVDNIPGISVVFQASLETDDRFFLVCYRLFFLLPVILFLTCILLWEIMFYFDMELDLARIDSERSLGTT